MRLISRTNNQTGYAWLLFFIWPFAMSGFALKNFRKSYAKNIIWAFTVFYGFTFYIGQGNEGADIVRYVEQFQILHNQELTISLAINYFLISGEIDILRTLIAVLLSRITDAQAALTVVYGIIYGYFFSRNMWTILERLQGKLKWITLLLVTTLFLVNPIWNLNGFRMYTAAHIFIYGLFQIYFNNKKSGIWFMAGSILVHFSFIFPLSVYFLYRLVGNKTTLFIAFFLTSFFISEINIQALNTVIEQYAPERVQERTEGYRTLQQVEQFQKQKGKSNKNWYAIWYVRALKWAVCGFLLLIWYRGFTPIKNEPLMYNLFNYVLLFYGFANILANLPSGGRFILVVNLAAVGIITLYMQNLKIPSIIKYYSNLSVPALLLFIVVSVRIGFYSVSIQSVASNPFITALFMDANVSLNEVLKGIF